jgi:NAD-dependent deacetylase
MITKVVDAIRRADAVVAITGAGMSAESGVPTFRGAEGLWRSFRPEELATPEAFARDPELVWSWYTWRRQRVAAATPNPGHLALARLESRLAGFQLVTQNVDGLHRQAGSQSVLEVHGNIWRARCVAEAGLIVDQAALPETFARVVAAGERVEVPRCACGALLRPDVVWFGEPLDPGLVARATLAVEGCDVLLVIGTSAVVYPVAGWPSLARRRGALVVEVNVAQTPLTALCDVVLRGPSGQVLPALEGAL